MLTDEEIAAFFALPAPARAALSAIPGPGWRWSDDRATDDSLVPVLIPVPRGIHVHESQMPCDPTEILKVASANRGTMPCSGTIGQTSGQKWFAAVDWTDVDEHTEFGETPRLAALRLLGKVWA